MPFELNETHDPARRSWIDSANEPGTDFPIQNLPFGIFRQRGPATAPKGGIAIGDRILDVSAIASLFREPARAAAIACEASTLNALMALGHKAASSLRLEVSRLLSTERAGARAGIEPHLMPMREAELHVPAKIGDFTDFYASVFHATNAGKMFRPDNPLLPNYKYVPVAYHSRASSVRVSGTAFHRPKGQVKPAEGPPVYQAARNLDYELELGFYIGVPPGTWRQTVPIETGGRTHFRLLPAQRLVGARHSGLGISTAGAVSCQELHDHGFALGGDDGSTYALSRARVQTRRRRSHAAAASV